MPPILTAFIVFGGVVLSVLCSGGFAIMSGRKMKEVKL